jgi:hypothetical protein
MSYNEDLMSPNLEGDDGDAHLSTFPCINFLSDAGILDDFLLLINRVGLTAYMIDESNQYAMLTKIFVESFKFTNAHFNPPTLRTSHMSSLIIMIMRHHLHLHESQDMITPMMTHQPGGATGARIDLHLGQKPKLGGRYADDSLIYISYFVGSLYIHVLLSFYFGCFLFLFLLSKTQKDQKYFRCFSLFGSLVFYL